ncbi:MAG: hypothetical protein D6732_14010 [Methanobacteriota archaeon]|nr:MAG: hypothetical protein D6732_14010 [Euryarchaeota archaeon]
MKRVKAKLPSWDDGKRFIKEVSEILQKDIEIRDANQVIETETYSVHMVPDDRGFAFITIKYADLQTGEKIEKILEKYVRT